MIGAFALYANGIVTGFFSVLFTVLIGLTLWNGASEAIRMGELRRRLPALSGRRAWSGRCTWWSAARRWPRRCASATSSAAGDRRWASWTDPGS